jgi:hypothetical protein
MVSHNSTLYHTILHTRISAQSAAGPVAHSPFSLGSVDHTFLHFFYNHVFIAAITVSIIIKQTANLVHASNV